jgi:hypothetical protein
VGKKPISERRYCIEKLVHYDKQNRLETWKLTKWCDDKTHVLAEMFLTEGTRIWDSVEKREVRRNVNLNLWIK